MVLLHIMAVQINSTTTQPMHASLSWEEEESKETILHVK